MAEAVAIEPFVKIDGFPFVVCRKCRFACVAKEVSSHLRARHTSMEVKERRRVAEQVCSMAGIIRDQAGLATFTFPPRTTDPIPFIAPPEQDGLRCIDEACQYVTRTVIGMQKHCRMVHGWRNSWVRGGDVARRAKQARDVPWTTGVRCQRIFRSRAASGWFEVCGDAATSCQQPAPAVDMMQHVAQIHRAQVGRFDARSEDTVKVADDKTEPSGWLDRTGWAQHLDGSDKPRLRETMRPIQPEESVLQAMWDSLSRVIDQARWTATSTKVGAPALFEVQRKQVHIKPSRPFDNRMEDDSWARYKDAWRKLLCVLHRTQVDEPEFMPPYRLTKRQCSAYDAFADAAEERPQAADPEASDERMDRLALEMVMSWLDHQFKESHYDNTMISGLAVMGMRDDGGWVPAIDYTPVYSAVIKVARMLVVSHSYLERQDEVAKLMETMDEEEARETATSIFTIVRRKVQRFMTVTTHKPDALPTPIDWIFGTCTYGMRIRYDTPAGGTIDWEGDCIKHRKVKFSMNVLHNMLHALVGEARNLLSELTAVEPAGIESLPPIEWSRLEDDHSEDRVGYSFLQDQRNGWLSKGDDWVIKRIVESKARCRTWFSEDSTVRASDNPYKAKAVRKYGRTLEQFRERLWMIMHMVAGQPARSTEILGIRHVNTVNGGIRNILAHQRMMCFVTSYHKGFRQTGQAKVIHRYLPREIGELLVWYLWLVLPFWQQVQGIVKQADNCSPFLWSDEIVSRTEAESDTERRERLRKEREGGGQHVEEREEWEPESDADPVGFADWIKERKWTSDRARRIIQRHSERLMGTVLTISAWRHMAIAISRRFLNKQFDDGGFGDEDEDGVDDSPADLQAGHGTHVAGMIYARALQQGGFGTAEKRDQFRMVSQQWHRFLGFGADDWSGAGRDGAGAKRRRAPFDSHREEARFQRFARLHRVDIRGELRNMMGDGAAFRGQQEDVIRAVVRGQGPILQVTGTGGGKSLSFMLPAYCSPEGTTIVIVPLTALREDMHGRCEKNKIDSYVWQSHGSHPVATVVFVTPESAVTKGFRDYVNRLQSRQVLDRVIVDECHVLLDASPEFRPKLLQLGGMIREWGVQRVFLTATLPPTDEAEFFRIVDISPERVHWFRTRTTRKNIAYRVTTVSAAPDKQEEEEDAEVCRVVQEWLGRQESGRVIVYGRTIPRVEKLAEALGCKRFHAKMDTAAGKAARFQEWVQDGPLIVATNALGLGVDVPDVRLVVHAGMPNRLRDYVQESGRAGRDGGRSNAVVVCRAAGGGGRQDDGQGTWQWEQSVEQFVEGKWCRRQVLDRVMDGWLDRTECETDEEVCDVCTRRYRAVAMAEEMMAREEEEEDKQASVPVHEIVTNYERQQRDVDFEQRKMTRETMKAATEAEEFREQLERWAGRCVVCHLEERREEHHGMEACPWKGRETWEAVDRYMARMEDGLFTKQRFAQFSACFPCGLPQRICSRWEAADDDGGTFRRVKGADCQYKGMMVKIYGGALACILPGAAELTEEMRQASGRAMDGDDEWFKWLGQKITWGGMETNRACQWMHRWCRLLEEFTGDN